MGKNTERIQSMLSGDYKRKLQVGYSTAEERREVGDKWTDLDGVEWEQRKGYRMKISKMADVGIFHMQCKDCNSNCSLEKKHIKTYNRFERCWYCQVDFEIKLKSWPGKWEAWVRLQQLNNMDSIERDLIQALEENEKLDKKKIFDKSVANALANSNVEMTIKKNQG
jgi:hypothetical protein